MKFIDLFSGLGTIRMGFEQAGHECVYSVEWDKHKRKIYEVIFGNEPEGKDIIAVRGADLPLADCWTFGAPCQDFSIAGTRSGMEGDRSSLIREVFRLVRGTPEEHRPEWLLYENVKGMLSSNKGFDCCGRFDEKTMYACRLETDKRHLAGEVAQVDSPEYPLPLQQANIKKNIKWLKKRIAKAEKEIGKGGVTV